MASAGLRRNHPVQTGSHVRFREAPYGGIVPQPIAEEH
jgi:hypothetical protein